MKPNKNAYNSDKENATFARKLRNLLEEYKFTQKDLAEYVEQKTGESITRQSIGQWCLGNTCPPLKTVPVIADFFGVSTDYLLTETEIKSPEADLLSVCEYTGLSEEAIKFLNDLRTRAQGDEIAPKFREHTLEIEKACSKKQIELEECLERNTKAKKVITQYLQYRQNNDFSNAEKIVNSYRDNAEYNRVFEIANGIHWYTSILQEEKTSSVIESKLALQALSKILCGFDRENFVNNLSLFFSYLKNDDTKRTVINTHGYGEDFQRSIILSDEIIDNVLLSEIQSYIKNLKDDNGSNQVSYSIEIEDCKPQKGDNDNG